MFCDWLINTDSLIRTYGIDLDELRLFQSTLLSAVSNASKIRIITEKGTDICIKPKCWNVSKGEIFTVPLEQNVNGQIVVDGCAYFGPPKVPFILKIENGRVANINELNIEDEQQKMVREDLIRDGNSNMLAELGIGINPGARWNADIMEAEQARGTCHFGFGHNIEYGGDIKSSFHFDLVIKNPTIIVDETIICRDGKYILNNKFK